MGILDGVKRFGQKAKNLVAKNNTKMKQTIDKAAGAVDSRTKGKYTEKIDRAATKAKETVDKIPDQPPEPDQRDDQPGPG